MHFERNAEHNFKRDVKHNFEHNVEHMLLRTAPLMRLALCAPDWCSHQAFELEMSAVMVQLMHGWYILLLAQTVWCSLSGASDLWSIILSSMFGAHVAGELHR